MLATKDMQSLLNSCVNSHQPSLSCNSLVPTWKRNGIWFTITSTVMYVLSCLVRCINIKSIIKLSGSSKLILLHCVCQMRECHLACLCSISQETTAKSTPLGVLLLLIFPRQNLREGIVCGVVQMGRGYKCKEHYIMHASQR